MPRLSRVRPGSDTRGEIERDAVDEVAQHESAAHVPVGDERQGCEEVLAELAVGGPGSVGAATSKLRLSMRTGRPASNWML